MKIYANKSSLTFLVFVLIFPQAAFTQSKPSIQQMESKLRSIWKSEWKGSKIISISPGRAEEYIVKMGTQEVPTPTIRQQFNVTADYKDGSQGIYRDFIFYQKVQGSWVFWKSTTDGRVKVLRGPSQDMPPPKFEEVEQSIKDFIYLQAENARKEEQHFLTGSKVTYPHNVNVEAKYMKKYKPRGYVTGFLYPNILKLSLVKLSEYIHDKDENGKKYYRNDMILTAEIEEQYKDGPDKKPKDSITIRCNIRVQMKAYPDTKKWAPFGFVECEPRYQKCECINNCQ